MTTYPPGLPIPAVNPPGRCRKACYLAAGFGFPARHKRGIAPSMQPAPLLSLILVACAPSLASTPTDTSSARDTGAESGLPINCQPWMHLAAVTCDEGAACVELSRLDRGIVAQVLLQTSDGVLEVAPAHDLGGDFPDWTTDRACIQCEPGDIARFALLTCRAGT